MTEQTDYVPPRVWTWDKESGGRFASINRPIAGPTHDKALPIGKHPLQLYSLGTPIGGLLGMAMGKNHVNIANFTLGRSGIGKEAIAILYLDQAIDPKVVNTLESTGMFQQVKPLHFEVA